MSRSVKKEKKFIELKLTNGEIINLDEGFKTCDDVSGNIKFSYGIARSQDFLAPVRKAIEKTNEVGKEFKQYELDRQKIVKEFTKELDGKPVNTVKFNNYSLDPEITDEHKFQKKVKALEEKNKKYVDARTAQIKKYIKFLEEEAIEKPKLHMIKSDDLPEDVTLAQMYNASFLLDIEIKDVTSKQLRVSEVLSITPILQALGEIKSEVFVDKMMFNLRMMKQVRDTVIFRTKEIKDYQQYLEERDQLRDDLCGITVMGKPAKSQLPSGSIVFHFEDSSEASRKIEEFKDKNKAVVDTYESYIESELEVEIKQLAWDELPDDITASSMKHILPFIKS